MKFSELMTYYDYNMANVARALDISRSYVQSWKIKESIPFMQQCKLQVITNGALLANRDDDKE